MTNRVIFALCALLMVATVIEAAGPSRTSDAGMSAKRLPLPLKLLWLDNETNPIALASRDAVVRVLDKAKAAGFNVIVPDTRNYCGLAFYDSKITSRPTSHNGVPYPPNFDLLRVVTEEAHQRGMHVHAGLNLFVEGGKGPSGRVGAVYEHPEWESVVYDVVPEIQLGSQRFTATAVNDRSGTSGIFVMTPAYGNRIFRLDAAENASDGVADKGMSRWVSADTAAPHYLDFRFHQMQQICSVTVKFPPGGVAKAFRVLSPAALLASTSNNTSPRVTLDCGTAQEDSHPPNNLPPHTLRLEITDPGADRIARIEEVEILDKEGRNVAPQAEVTADSSMSRGHGSIVTMRAGKIAAIVREDELTSAGIEIPRDGVLLIVDGGTAGDVLSSAQPGTPVAVTAETKLRPETQVPGGLLVYVNPANPDVQQRVLAVIDEVLADYDVDGVILDRTRYDNFKVDFSELSRRRFEREMKVRINHWPEDIYIPANPLTGEELKKGPLHDKWILWRAKVIHDFIAQTRKVVDKHPGRILGDYVGAWYPTYWQVGVNWAADNYDPRQDFDWAPSGYTATGYAQMLDYLSPGVYYTTVRKSDAGGELKLENSIEGGIELVQKVTAQKVPLAPGLYVPNLNSDEAYEAAIRLCIEKAGGVMIFSHSTLEKSNRWEATRRGLETVPQLPE
jgi:hypothetical protein